MVRKAGTGGSGRRSGRKSLGQISAVAAPHASGPMPPLKSSALQLFRRGNEVLQTLSVDSRSARVDPVSLTQPTASASKLFDGPVARMPCYDTFTTVRR